MLILLVSHVRKHCVYVILLQAGRGKGMGKLSMWSEKIVNHFWYCCQACGQRVDMLKVHKYVAKCCMPICTEPCI